MGIPGTLSAPKWEKHSPLCLFCRRRVLSVKERRLINALFSIKLHLFVTQRVEVIRKPALVKQGASA